MPLIRANHENEAFPWRSRTQSKILQGYNRDSANNVLHKDWTGNLVGSCVCLRPSNKKSTEVKGGRGGGCLRGHHRAESD